MKSATDMILARQRAEIATKDATITQLREALETIRYMHDGNMPDALAGMSEVDYARRTISSMHREARAALESSQ